MVPSVAGAKKDIISIYNNRSAMYERVKNYDASLEDIAVLLSTDKAHAKARGRRCRIYEAQVSNNNNIIQ